jgi:prevent-host-death family protein
MKSFSLSELNRAPGQIVDAALAAPVGLTKHGKRKLVVMNAVEYELLKHGKAFRIEDAPDVINGILVEGLTQALDRDA